MVVRLWRKMERNVSCGPALNGTRIADVSDSTSFAHILQETKGRYNHTLMVDGRVRRASRAGLILALASILAIVGCAINIGQSKTASLTSITVSPAAPSVALGLSQQFTASGTYSNGN